MIYINILMILTIITVVWDISGFLTDVTKKVYELTHKKEWMGQQLPKIISCSYCVKFHSVWVYLIIFNNYSIITGLFITCISTFLGILIKNLLTKLTNKLNEN